MSSSCALKRCQGKWGCICPKGSSLPVGTYAGTNRIIKNKDLLEHEQSEMTPNHRALVKSKGSKTSLPLIHSRKNIVSIPKSTVQESSKAQATIQPVYTTDDVPSVIAADGAVIIRYNHYKKSFAIKAGSTTAEAVDAEYFLTFAYPGSKIHLSMYSPSDFSYEEKGYSIRPRIVEHPAGVYQGLKVDHEYWVDIEEDSKEREEYEKRQQKMAEENARKRAALEAEEKNDAGLIVKAKSESCSCIEGNPCLDRYCCKDWEHRYEVAKKHGWKGFQ